MIGEDVKRNCKETDNARLSSIIMRETLGVRPHEEEMIFF